MPADALSAAIEAAVERWEGLIRGAALRYGLAGPELDEIVQDIRIRLWRALEKPNEKKPAESASYVYRAAMSAALDFLRRRRASRFDRQVELESVSNLMVETSANPTDEDRQVAALSEALAGISADRRTAVRLHLEGRSREEIQELTGWSEARTRNLLYRGLADLKARLQPEQEPE